MREQSPIQQSQSLGQRSFRLFERSRSRERPSIEQSCRQCSFRIFEGCQWRIFERGVEAAWDETRIRWWLHERHESFLQVIHSKSSICELYLFARTCSDQTCSLIPLYLRLVWHLWISSHSSILLSLLAILRKTVRINREKGSINRGHTFSYDTFSLHRCSYAIFLELAMIWTRALGNPRLHCPSPRRLLIFKSGVESGEGRGWLTQNLASSGGRRSPNVMVS